MRDAYDFMSDAYDFIRDAYDVIRDAYELYVMPMISQMVPMMPYATHTIS